MHIPCPYASTILLATALHVAAAEERAMPESPAPVAAPGGYSACGVDSLYTSCQILGVETSVSQVETLLSPDANGMTSFSDLERASRQLGLWPCAIQISRDQLDMVPSPSILHVHNPGSPNQGDHFVVYLGLTRNGGVAWLDPPAQPEEISGENFDRVATGKVLALCRSRSDVDALRARLKRANATSASLWQRPLFWSASALISVVIFSVFRPRVKAPAGQGA